MRDKWYSDNRDLVKWASLVHLAKSSEIETILQVAFYRPEKLDLMLDTSTERVKFPIEVARHFRDLDQIQRFAKAVGLHIEVFKEPFWAGNGSASRKVARQTYIEKVTRAIKGLHPRPMILFLDPDTGIAPKTYGWKHVRPEEIRDLFSTLKGGDWIVFYQHKRRQSGWLENCKRQFANAVGVDQEIVKVYKCAQLAPDVGFFAIQKT